MEKTFVVEARAVTGRRWVCLAPGVEAEFQASLPAGHMVRLLRPDGTSSDVKIEGYVKLLFDKFHILLDESLALSDVPRGSRLIWEIPGNEKKLKKGHH
jgi:hypothetical protein